jgi:hypothetical protein
MMPSSSTGDNCHLCRRLKGIYVAAGRCRRVSFAGSGAFGWAKAERAKALAPLMPDHTGKDISMEYDEGRQRER